MLVAGIIAEYNPFHRGHAWQIAQTRRLLGEDCAVVCIMSGHWAQGGDCAVTDKWTRAGLALSGGADLVLELPVVWAASSAERFARGAVAHLAATGVVNYLCFGSEEGAIAPLQAAAHCLDSADYPAALRGLLKQGLSFPAARQAAVVRLRGDAGACLSTPNNTLGVEYLRALRYVPCRIEPITVRRRGCGHHPGGTGDAIAPEEGFRSATEIRRMLRGEDWAAAEACLLPGAAELLRAAGRADLHRCERAILARLRAMTAEDFSRLPDAGGREGLDLRLADCARRACTAEEFLTLAKTRRYPLTRLRRLMVSAFLGLTEDDRPAGARYLRVLGSNERGRGVLRQMKERATLPVITKPAHGKALEETARRLLAIEARATDLFELCLPAPRPCGRDWITTPVIR